VANGRDLCSFLLRVLRLSADGAFSQRPTSVERGETARAAGCVAPCPSHYTPAPYAEPRPLLQRLSPTLCTSTLIFTDTFVTGADPSSRWLCFGRGAPRICSELERTSRLIRALRPTCRRV
jgi:hypothetical protein